MDSKASKGMGVGRKPSVSLSLDLSIQLTIDLDDLLNQNELSCATFISKNGIVSYCIVGGFLYCLHHRRSSQFFRAVTNYRVSHFMAENHL